MDEVSGVVLNVSTKSNGSYVEINANLAGIDELIQELVWLRERVVSGESEHFHLPSKSAGGNELTEALRIASENINMLVIELKVNGWTREWIDKHGFK